MEHKLLRNHRAHKSGSARSLKHNHFSKANQIVFILAFAAIGGTTLLLSHAAGPTEVWVSTSGDDSTCVRGDSTKPCATFNQAYQLAQAGDAVEVAAGSYPGQTLSGTKAGDAGCNGNSGGVTSGCITFEPAPDASVTVAGLTDDADYTHIEGIVVSGGVAVQQPQCAAPTGPWPSGSPTDVILSVISAGEFTIDGGNNIVINGGSFGPHTNGSSVFAACGTLTAGNPTTNGLVDGVTMHDYHYTTDGVHMECIHDLGVAGLIIQNSNFLNCGIFDILLSSEGVTNNTSDVTIQNDTFDVARGLNDATSGGSSDLGIEQDCSSGSCANVVTGITIRFNSFAGNIADESYGDTGESWAGTNTNIYGNIFTQAYSSFECGVFTRPGFNFSYNVTGATGGVVCGTGSVAYDNPFVDATDGAENFNPAPASAAIDLVPTSVSGGCPTTDIAGTARPQGSACDAGAYEAVSNMPIPGDLNGDGHVTIADLSILLTHYGQSATAAQGDLNGDGKVTIADLSILLSHYGE